MVKKITLWGLVCAQVYGMEPLGTQENPHEHTAPLTQRVMVEEVIPQDGPTKPWTDTDTTYTRVIGLGANCCTKSMINAYFGKGETNGFVTKKGHADLFDWMIVHDYELLAKALCVKLEDIFEHSDLEYKKFYWPTIMNHRYDLECRHVFDNHPGGIIVAYSNRGGIITNDNLTLTIDNPNSEPFVSIKQKIDHLRGKFLEAAKYDTLYVIADPYPIEIKTKTNKDTLYRLRDSLKFARGGNAHFSILYVTTIMAASFDFGKDEGIMVYHAPKLENDPIWVGNLERWHEIFDQFKFAADIWD